MPVDPVPEPDLTFTVHGIPAQKGSKRAFLHKTTQRVVMVDDNNAKLRSWERLVNDVVQGLASGGQAPLDEPLYLDVTFRMPRPKSLPKRAAPWHRRKPDLDKLVRALADPLVGAGIIRDDALFSEIAARKRYVWADELPGAVVRIWKMATREPEAVVPKMESRSHPGVAGRPRKVLLDAPPRVASGDR